MIFKIIFVRMLHTVYITHVGYGVQVTNVGMCAFLLASMEVLSMFVCVCVCVCVHKHTWQLALCTLFTLHVTFGPFT